MSRTGRVFVWVAFLVVTSFAPVGAQTTDDDSAERQTVERFASVLEKNPRRGTAFDKVYSYHVERGSLSELAHKYQTQAKDRTGAEAASCWTIVGLIENQRGRDTQAIEAFTQAEKSDPKNATASYYLGRILAATDQTNLAAEAFERAIERQLSPADLLETFQALGRLYQRSQQRHKAMAVWTRLEQQFPNDARVQELIATTLLEENDLAAALSRYEALAKSSRDKSRQLTFEVEAADIKSQLGQSTEAIQDFERILKQLNPDHWQYRDIRRRVEGIYQRSNNQAGLIAYYQKWLEQNPSDLDAITRLARQLIGANRNGEAQEWLHKGLKVAPSNKELRLALINQLSLQNKYADAIAQYAELDRVDPNNPDTLKAWGRTLLKDPSRAPAQRQQAATAVWRRMLAIRPNDAQTTAQVADLLRQSGIVDEALALYRQAIELAPDAAQYREYLGDYLQSEKRTAEALVAWREIATGNRKTAPNLARLAEILARVGELPDAIEANAAACQLDPKDFALQLKRADLLSRASRHQDALTQLAIVEKLVATEEERESVWSREFTALRELKQLPQRIADVRKARDSAASKDPHDEAVQWHWLARAFESESQASSALNAIRRASELDRNSIRILITSARLHEGQQALNTAVEQYHRLASVDRRFRSEYLQRIAMLEETLGHRKQALQAGRDLLAAAPGNPEFSSFFAELCFRTNQHDEGLQTLRKAVRANPAELGIRMRLAAVLMERKQTTEAIDLLWQAFERSESVDDRLLVVQKLAEAHKSTNELNRLYIRLERERRDAERHREMTFCLAKVYEVSGDYRTAQIKLETLLTEGTRDTQVLTQLRYLAEHQQNFAGAASYQRRIWEISDAKEDRSLLVRLLMRAGKTDDAVAILIEESGPQELSADLMSLIDGLVVSGKATEAAGRLKLIRTQFPQNWELLFREAAILTRSSRAASIERFEELLRLNLRDDDPSLAGPPTRQNFTVQNLPAVDRLAEIPSIQQSIQMTLNSGNAGMVIRSSSNVTLTNQGRVWSVQTSPAWQPRDFGQARVAALCWLVQSNAVTAVENKLHCKSLPELESPTQRQHYLDRLAVFTCLRRVHDQVEAARAMAKAFPDDIEAKILLLTAINERAEVETVQLNSNTKSRAALPADELDDLLSMYREIAKRPDLSPYNVILLAGVQRELYLANQLDVLRELGADAVSKASTDVEVAHLLLRQHAGIPSLSLPVLLDRLIAIRSAPAAAARTSQSSIVAALNREELAEILAMHMEQMKSADELLSIWTRYARIQSLAGIPVAPVQQPNGVPTFRSRRSFSIARRTTTIQFMGISPFGSPLDGSIIDQCEFLMLKLVRDQFVLEKRDADLTKALQAEVDVPDLSAMGRLIARSAVAAVQSLSGERAEAADSLWEIAQENPQRQDLRVGVARQFFDAEKPEKALEILDGTDANACPENVRRMLAMRFASAANNNDRAKVEATALANKVLPQHELEELVDYLMDMEMYDVAEQALTRSGTYRSFLPLQRHLMVSRMKQDKLDDAVTVALDLLKQLDQPASRPQDQGLNRAELRQDCFEVLQKSGRLAVLIENAEKALVTSPRSEDLLDRLISYYAVTENQTRFHELEFKKLELRADRPENRFAIGLKLMEADKIEQAVERFQMLIERDPRYLATTGRDALFRYDNRKELTKFASILSQLDWGAQDQQLIELPSVISQLRFRPATASMGDELFLRTWEAHPERRGQLLELFRDDHWWNKQEVHSQFASAIIPQSSVTGATEEWKIFGRIQLKDDTTGALSTVLNRIIEVTASQQKLGQLAIEIERAIQQQPDWETGPVILALIDLNRGRVEAGRDALDKLRPKIGPLLIKRPVVAWEIALELARHPQSLDVAATYFDIAIQQSEHKDWGVGASPGRALIDAFAKHGRKEDGRQLLLRNLPAGLRADATLESRPQPTDIAQVLSICHRLTELGYPMDTISICGRTLERIEKLRVGGYDPRVELQTRLIAALAELKPESLPRYVAEAQPLSMLLFVQGTGRESYLKSRWDSLLAEVAKSGELTSQTQNALSKRLQSDADTFAPLIMSTRLAFSTGDNDRVADNIVKITQRLQTEASRLESANADGKETKSTDSVDHIALWLIARRCLIEPKLHPSAVALAERAFEATRGANQSQMRLAIRNEWLQIAKDAGDTATIERLENDVD